MDSKKQRRRAWLCCENWTAKFALHRILCTSIQLEKHEDSDVDFVENTKIDNIELL
jgi:hypothetical protein